MVNSPSDDEEPLPQTLSEQFRKVLPYYMSIGMSVDEFWNQDPMLVKYYREAEKIRNEKRNQELWLQGMYIYDAILCASPILHAFAKKGSKPAPYPQKPYSITDDERKKEAKNKAKAMHDKGLQMMQRFMGTTNEKFKGKE